MDRISKEHRSWNMSRIKSQNTKPEILESLGWRVVIIWECEIRGKELGELQGVIEERLNG